MATRYKVYELMDGHFYTDDESLIWVFIRFNGMMSITRYCAKNKREGVAVKYVDEILDRKFKFKEFWDHKTIT